MTISYDTVKGTATKIFMISIPEKYSHLRFEVMDCTDAVRAIQKNLELHNYSFILETSQGDFLKLSVRCKGSTVLERLEAKYNSEYFHTLEEKIIPLFLTEITKLLSLKLVYNEARNYSHNTYNPSALRVKSTTPEIKANELLLAKQKEALKLLEQEIKKTQIQLLELTKPIAVNEIQNNALFSDYEKESIIQMAHLK